jgi:hypothetical protein
MYFCVVLGIFVLFICIFCVVLCISCVVLCIFVLFQVFLCCFYVFLCCSMYFCIVLCIFVLFLCIFCVVLCIFCVVLCIFELFLCIFCVVLCIFLLFYVFCVVLCIVCVCMCIKLLPPGGYPIAVKYIISQNTEPGCRVQLTIYRLFSYRPVLIGWRLFATPWPTKLLFKTDIVRNLIIGIDSNFLFDMYMSYTRVLHIKVAYRVPHKWRHAFYVTRPQLCARITCYVTVITHGRCNARA